MTSPMSWQSCKGVAGRGDVGGLQLTIVLECISLLARVLHWPFGAKYINRGRMAAACRVPLSLDICIP